MMFLNKIFGKKKNSEKLDKPKPTKIWAYRLFDHMPWTKVITNNKPESGRYMHHLMGPFENEKDCDDFCDRSNLNLRGLYKPYIEPNKYEEV